MDLGLTGRHVFVAGSSRGIGRAIARAFLAEGGRVTIAARSAAGVAAARAELSADADAERVHAVVADLTVPADVDRAVTVAEQALGPLDVVVANVGSGAARMGIELTAEDWAASLNTNLLGGMALATRVLPGMTARRSGNVIFVSSIAGMEAIAAPVPYAAAKAALNMAAKSLARQVGEASVRVNVIAPGNVLFPGGSWERRRAERGAEVDRYIEAEVALKRFASVEEIADVVVFLASDRASFVTGSLVVVDGGQTRTL